MPAYYNEIDPYAAQWLRNLIQAGHIAPGEVDERSIVDVRPDDLAGFDQCHFFAGIGGWSLAARLAGWPDHRPLWTGSCPCQPFSAAGKRKGTADERHLWPELRRLVAACRPTVVAGEQVASKDGRVWLAGVRADLEDMAYGVWAADICAAGVGAPHIRQRIWWLADADEGGRNGRPGHDAARHRGAEFAAQDHFASGRLAHADIDGCDGWRSAGGPEAGIGAGAGCSSAARRVADAAEPRRHEQPRRDGGADGWPAPQSGRLRDAGRLGDAEQPGLEGYPGHGHNSGQPGRVDQEQDRSTPAAGSARHWDAFDLLQCTDGKARRIEPGTFPLAHGVSNRVGRLRAYGNAINPYVAAEILSAFLECQP